MHESRQRGLISAGLLRAVFVFVVIALVVAEGYYIISLRNRINRQTEELKSISLQLQEIKNEKTELNKELSTIKGIQGSGKVTDSPERGRE